MTSTTKIEIRKNEILKVDSRGRVQISCERRDALLDEFEKSGMSGAGFARHYGIKYSTFAYWILARRRKRTQRKALSGKSQFLLVKAESPESDNALSIELPHGVRMTITSQTEVELAASLISALGTGN